MRLTENERNLLANVLAGGVSRRVNDPHLVSRQHGATQWGVIDKLRAAGLISQHIRATGPRRSIWINITRKGIEALQR